MKTRIHNEYFQPLKKTTCSCGAKKTECFAWGEYSRGKWYTVDHFCKNCFDEKIIPRLTSHAKDCGCSFNLIPRSGYTIPDWIKLNTCTINARVN